MPPSHSIEQVQDHHKEALGPGNAEKGPAAPYSSFQAGSSISSGPKGARDHLPLLLPLELLVGSIQVCEHLQQVDSCLSLPGQGIRTGPWERDKGFKGAQPGQGRLPQPTPHGCLGLQVCPVPWES